jgi:hypothetical protein
MLPRSTTITITLQINHFELSGLVSGHFNAKTVLPTQAESLQHIGTRLPSFVFNTIIGSTANTLLTRQHKNLTQKDIVTTAPRSTQTRHSRNLSTVVGMEHDNVAQRSGGSGEDSPTSSNDRPKEYDTPP